ncbi:MAG: TetR family transcriptional regulator C-terminal domain-containing protein, partial [Lachnospiraceae bacterium]|nr:TetR family transcriptional regulator C-terminal domain-containing protein [Lachnospiraceae bacterium]
LMNTFHPKNDWDLCKSYYLAICEYTMTNPLLANLLTAPIKDGFFEKVVTMFHHYVKEITQNNAPSHPNSEELSYMVACTIGSTVGVLHKWAKDNFKIPPETIANILTRAFISGMLPYIL